MVKLVEVKSIGQFIDNVFSLGEKRSKDTGHIFRGINNKEYKLCSSLYRNCNGKYIYAENRLLQNFRKYTLSMVPHVCDSIWSNMIIAQHHGIPTRLLDFSSSPLIALHFALVNNEDADAAVWAVNLSQIHTNLLPSKYMETLKKYNAFSFTIDMLEEMNITIEDYNRDMGKDHFLVIEPPSIDTRIINQGSLFAILPNALDPLDDFLDKSKEDIAVKYIIPAGKIHSFRMQLDEMNITERILFNDLDGIARYLKRRYQ